MTVLSSNRYFTLLSTSSIFMPMLNDYLLISRSFLICYYRDNSHGLPGKADKIYMSTNRAFIDSFTGEINKEYMERSRR